MTPVYSFTRHPSLDPSRPHVGGGECCCQRCPAVLLFAAFLFLAVSCVSCNWIREGRWQVYQDDGTRSLEKGHYAEAERQWNGWIGAKATADGKTILFGLPPEE